MKRYESRSDDAGRLVRHLRREAGSLWVFLNEPGVEPTNNRAERALRFGVLVAQGFLGYGKCQRQRLGATESIVASDVPATGAIELFGAGGRPRGVHERTAT